MTKRLSRDGLPVDARDWQYEDWQDLHEAIEKVKRNVARRHSAACTPEGGAGDSCPRTTERSRSADAKANG